MIFFLNLIDTLVYTIYIAYHGITDICAILSRTILNDIPAL